MSYAQDIYNDVNVLANDPAIVGDLSPAARATLGLVKFSLDQALQGKSPQQIAEALADEAIGLGLQTGQQLLTQLAASVSADLGAMAGAVIPYVGWIVSMLLNAKPAGNVASVKSYTEGALEVYAPIGQAGHSPGFGTGPGGVLLPVDLFIRAEKPSKNGQRRFEYTSMGMTLASITEYDGDMDRVRKKYGKNVGIPYERRMVFRAIRRRIAQSYNRTSDGGAALWTIYLDLLRHEFDCGHLTPAVALYLDVFAGAYNRKIGNAETDGSARWSVESDEYEDIGAVTRKLLESGKNAAQALAVSRNVGAWTLPTLFDSRSRQQVYDTVQGWRQTLDPKYVQFQTLEQKVVAFLKAKGKPVIKLTLPPKGPKVTPALVKAAASASKTAPAQHAAIAGAASAWAKLAGPQPVGPKSPMPKLITPQPPGTLMTTSIPGLSFKIEPQTQARAAGLGSAAPALGLAALLFLA